MTTLKPLPGEPMTDTSKIMLSLDLGDEYVAAVQERIALAADELKARSSDLVGCTSEMACQLSLAMTDAARNLAHEVSALLPPLPEHVLRAATVMSRAEGKTIKVMIPVRYDELWALVRSALPDLQQCATLTSDGEVLVSGAGWRIVVAAADPTNGSGDGLSCSEKKEAP